MSVAPVAAMALPTIPLYGPDTLNSLFEQYRHLEIKRKASSAALQAFIESPMWDWPDE